MWLIYFFSEGVGHPIKPKIHHKVLRSSSVAGLYISLYNKAICVAVIHLF